MLTVTPTAPSTPSPCTRSWTVPSSIGVSGFSGDSLFGLLNASVAENLAHFPTGPALDDKFWLYLISWHVGWVCSPPLPYMHLP